MAVIGQIGFAASKKLVARLRKSAVSHAVFILQDELLGPLVVHGSASRLRVTTLEEFESEHRMVGVVQPKVQLGPALAQVLDDLRAGRVYAPCTELICEVLRRGGHPGAFSLRKGITAVELHAFLSRPQPVSREAVRLFNSSGGGTALNSPGGGTTPNKTTPRPRDP